MGQASIACATQSANRA